MYLLAIGSASNAQILTNTTLKSTKRRQMGYVEEQEKEKCGLAFHTTCGLNEDLCIEYRERKKKSGGGGVLVSLISYAGETTHALANATPRYALRSMTKENKKPPLPQPKSKPLLMNREPEENNT
ncbi:hypothetical protein ACFE04_026245 [Oxalis oulophora]